MITILPLYDTYGHTCQQFQTNVPTIPRQGTVMDITSTML